VIREAARTVAAAAIAGAVIAWAVVRTIHRDIKPENMIRRPRTGPLWPKSTHCGPRVCHGRMKPIPILLVALAACGASSRESTIAHTIQGLDAAGATLHAYGPAHELDLVNTSTSHAAFDAALASWKKTRTELELGLEACYRALAVADSDSKLDAAVKQAVAFYASLTAAGVIGGGK
jgi:hypothetical protein